MISDFFEIFLLSIIQGVSEFIPVSSAAHLILASNMSDLSDLTIVTYCTLKSDLILALNMSDLSD